jgi:hypothetical protein
MGYHLVREPRDDIRVAEEQCIRVSYLDTTPKRGAFPFILGMLHHTNREA